MSALSNKTKEDLNKTLKERQAAIRMFRFGLSGSKVKNLKEGRSLKKEVAQILTELASRAKAK